MKNNLLNSILILLWAVGLISCAHQEKTLVNDRPNVILINVDDLGWKDLGYMGAEYYETPNIDRLAEQGAVFTQAYAGAANCAPSRANMLTGRYGMRHGVYTVHPADRGHPKTRRLIPSHNEKFIPSDIPTMGHLFKSKGYKTGTFGKWHVSMDPHEYGFDVNIAGGPQGNPGKGGYFSPYNVDHIEAEKEGEYLTDRLTDEAVQFVSENKDRPFFLYLPFYTVHGPLMAKEEDLARFENKKGKPGRDNATYAAMIYNMDKNVGKLLHAVDAMGLTDNTIIIFTSDNGGIRATSHQDPLRAGKGSYYEGGIRVPLIISWRDEIDPVVIESPVSQMDFFPTLQYVLGAEEFEVDGENIYPLLKGKEQEERDLFWHFPIYLQAYKPQEDQARDPLFRTRPGSVIRSGDWKLHQYFEDGGIELYNLKEDIGEKNNLAAEFPDIKEALMEKLNHWRTEHRAPVPNDENPQFDAAFEKKKIKALIAN
ncbi:sulfatase [Echinicola shivajiensis]|uniref:sulfatase n=1 Tax=Echinicola shivajiensis TaxID=1035916 RepID=UPI001BFCB54C|nr:sulfatase [Echinicola shivajiensis]